MRRRGFAGGVEASRRVRRLIDSMVDLRNVVEQFLFQALRCPWAGGGRTHPG
jgi:hypothetical protein